MDLFIPSLCLAVLLGQIFFLVLVHTCIETETHEKQHALELLKYNASVENIYIIVFVKDNSKKMYTMKVMKNGLRIIYLPKRECKTKGYIRGVTIEGSDYKDFSDEALKKIAYAGMRCSLNMSLIVLCSPILIYAAMLFRVESNFVHLLISILVALLIAIIYTLVYYNCSDGLIWRGKLTVENIPHKWEEYKDICEKVELN